jgi:2-oxoglutarate dehydrogenase E2 component (dihydrolipoamide succinyltransferase)
MSDTGRSMKTEVKVPEVGESVTQGVIAAWLKTEGDQVTEGADLFELETDKATLTVPSPAGGVLAIIVREGEEVTVGQVVASIEAAKGAAGKAQPAAAQRRGAATPQRDLVDFEINIDERISGPPSAAVDKETRPEKDEGVIQTPSETPPLSPAVRRLVEEHQLDPRTIAGSGKDGRITKGDVLQHLDERNSKTAGEKRPPQVPPPAAKPAVPAGPTQRREKMTTIRKRIADNLLQVRHGAAHVTTFNEIDMSRVMSLRSQYRDAFERKHGVRLGFMSFFVKACCSALDAYPVVNAWIDGDDIVYNRDYNIGIAVATERGLIVPVIRGADRLSLADIERSIRDFADRAGSKKITVDELTGGTFSITNGGVFGSMLSTPIPSPPQSAILGMHAIRERPVAIKGEVVVRPVMYVALTYDHRLIDGREAVSFLIRVRECIEDPERMFIDI